MGIYEQNSSPELIQSIHVSVIYTKIDARTATFISFTMDLLPFYYFS